ncbi:nitrilase-related carbon-nitrogen hydrolase [Desulfosporosinus metallidurans]|uniref:Carbon-nitrogen hydrolase family protein n=1 Tax=Desulfosporosinus metallidurans TaxID=1888891 RepID=A0A1Q8QXE0_9FIRM|nr:nitrilase-related carbon-nitrogen hydrolase [Desulfosporosinus metallidurans]OLN32012.1 carbon-nitrogen hydrolase family protein [Desulfosporosinus metallidurans]
MSRNVTIALAQTDSVLGDVTASCAKAEALIRKAASQGAQIVCLPELCTTGYRQDLLGDKLWELAEPVEPTPGPTVTHFSSLAKELGLYIILPMIEQGTMPGIVHNSAVFINKNGTVQGVFRKVHAFATERYYFTDGNSYPVFETEFGKVGIMICYDMGFPEVARVLTLQGAEIIFAPSAWCQEDEDVWDINIPARALENRVFLAAVNRVGSEEDLVMHGKSKVVDTRGRTLVEAARFQEDLVCATVDLNTLRQARHQTPYLKDRKPHTYELITKCL